MTTMWLPGPTWFAFLDARTKAIQQLLAEGFEPEQIVKMMNLVDGNQVLAIHIVNAPKLPCPHCGVPVVERLQHYNNDLGCWQCKRPGPISAE